MTVQATRLIAEAYRWQRRLGHPGFEHAHCHIVANPAFPSVWDVNHADEVSARSEAEIETVLAAMDERLAHTPWRVVHTDLFTPDAVLARLAFDGYEERPVTIQMALQGALSDRGPTIEMRPVVSDADWGVLQRLVALDHAEGRKSGDLDLSSEFAASATAANRAKGADYPYNLVIRGGEAVAYGAYAIAPNGVGMIEDLFTLPSARCQGIATAMIAAFTDRLQAQGCDLIFLGALASERPKHLYARLGFRPVGLARAWVLEKT